MYTSLKNFLGDWKNECASSEKLFANITDASLNQKIYAHGRELGRLAWHIVISTSEILNTAGIKMQDEKDEGYVPSAASEIIKKLKETNQSSIEALQKNWTDDMLPEEIPVYGRQWTRGFVLTMLIHHHIHHRGQMTVLMRQAGLKVPGMFGPSREEWMALGRTPLA
jgi:uncharacterized damage-inducible protein DinB